MYETTVYNRLLIVFGIGHCTRTWIIYSNCQREAVSLLERTLHKALSC